MIEVADRESTSRCASASTGARSISSCSTRMMDENARRRSRKDARDVTMEAMVVSALRSADSPRSYGLRARSDHHQRQGQRRAGPGRCLSRARRALRLSAAPRAHRSRHGQQRHRRPARAALGILLQEGIGDTIRVSLTPAPDGDRTEEVMSRSRFCSRLGSAASPRKSPPAPVADARPAPSSRRWREQIQSYLREQMPVWKQRMPAWKR